MSERERERERDEREEEIACCVDFSFSVQHGTEVHPKKREEHESLANRAPAGCNPFYTKVREAKAAVSIFERVDSCRNMAEISILIRKE